MLSEVANLIVAATYVAVPAILFLIHRESGGMLPRAQDDVRRAFAAFFATSILHRVCDVLSLDGASVRTAVDVAGACVALWLIVELMNYRRWLAESIKRVKGDGGGANP